MTTSKLHSRLFFLSRCLLPMHFRIFQYKLTGARGSKPRGATRLVCFDYRSFALRGLTQRMAARRLACIVVLSNGAAGAEKQALALSARLRLRLAPASHDAVDCVRVSPTRFAQTLPPLAHVAVAAAVGDPLFGYALSASDQRLLLHGDRSASPQSHRKPLAVVVGCGRTTVALGVALKRAARADVFAVQIQHPRVPLSCFDAVVAPRHDFSAHTQAAPPSGLFLTTGTVHDVSQELLALAASDWRTRLRGLVAARRGCVAWLVGGPCRGFAFSPDDASAMVRQFVRVLHSGAVVAAVDGGDGRGEPAVLVTFSRRTPAKVRGCVHYTRVSPVRVVDSHHTVECLAGSRWSRSLSANCAQPSEATISSLCGTARARTRTTRSWRSRRSS